MARSITAGENKTASRPDEVWRQSLPHVVASYWLQRRTLRNP
jgi:hypothetical protein